MERVSGLDHSRSASVRKRRGGRRANREFFLNGHPSIQPAFRFSRKLVDTNNTTRTSATLGQRVLTALAHQPRECCSVAEASRHTGIVPTAVFENSKLLPFFRERSPPIPPPPLSWQTCRQKKPTVELFTIPRSERWSTSVAAGSELHRGRRLFERFHAAVEHEVVVGGDESEGD